MSRRILLLGATGAFGSRLAAMVSAMHGVELVLAAREPGRLEALRARLKARGARAALSVQPLDRRRPEDLASIQPWLVVDAAGPFQGADYGLALAAAELGAHYIDLADARAFVAGFPGAMDAAASRAGVLATTGASSTPALSDAALQRLTHGWRRLDEVVVAISPSARAPLGLSVVRAVLSYAGQPVRVFSDGRWGLKPGWSGLRRIDMPGLGRRWASICETPDLDLLPGRFPVHRQALFLAGLEFGPMHLGLSLLSLAVRWRGLPTLRPLASALRAVANRLAPLGSGRGGMIVDAEGEDADGTPIRARWSLLARANSGPNVPAAPAAALIRALVDGRDLPRGAMACVGLVDLDAIMRELDAFPVSARIDESHPEARALFRRLLGRRFDRLPAPVRTIHGAVGPAVFSGRAIARAGGSPPARLLRLVLGLPRSGRSDVEVRLTPDARGETWARRFGTARFTSRLVDVRELGVFEERFGPLRFRFDLQPTPRGVIWRMIGWGVVGLPLPLRFAPRMHARGIERRGRYLFQVAVAHPWTGLLFAYRGDLA